MVSGSQGECEGAAEPLFRCLRVSADEVRAVWMKKLLFGPCPGGGLSLDRQTPPRLSDHLTAPQCRWLDPSFEGTGENLGVTNS